jgi:hypothetical protein
MAYNTKHYWVFVLFPSSGIQENRTSFRNVVFSIFLNTRRWKKSKNPVILKSFLVIRFVLVSCLAYSSIMKMEATFSSET